MKPIPQTLRLGDQGDMVKAVQYLVGVPAYGKYDALTQMAVQSYQSRHRLTVTGSVDLETFATMFPVVEENSYDGVYGTPSISPTGILDRETIILFQKNNGLVETGFLDPSTLKKFSEQGYNLSENSVSNMLPQEQVKNLQLSLIEKEVESE